MSEKRHLNNAAFMTSRINRPERPSGDTGKNPRHRLGGQNYRGDNSTSALLLISEIRVMSDHQSNRGSVSFYLRFSVDCLGKIAKISSPTRESIEIGAVNF